MKNILIIYPHWIPSNLVGTQRARLIANFLPEMGWHPIILAVDPRYYEEPLAPELEQLVSPEVEVIWCKAFPTSKRFRLVGDIALRGFLQLSRAAIRLIRSRQIDFIWIPIFPAYSALIGRLVHEVTKVPYGIDYMDPWVHDFPGCGRVFSRAWAARSASRFLEPIAVKKAALLTGVSELSYLPVVERNPRLSGIVSGAMPLGFDPRDFACRPASEELLWDSEEQPISPWVYAGAFLPRSHYYVDMMFQIISGLRKENLWPEEIRLYFIGTGRSTELPSVSFYAQKHGIEDIVREFPDRISYLRILHHLSTAARVLAIGNTEPHYTASKIFQLLLCRKPMLAVFHARSTVNRILADCRADRFLVQYDEEQPEDGFRRSFRETLLKFLREGDSHFSFDPQGLDPYSAKASCRRLVELIEKTEKTRS